MAQPISGLHSRHPQNRTDTTRAPVRLRARVLRGLAMAKLQGKVVLGDENWVDQSKFRKKKPQGRKMRAPSGVEEHPIGGISLTLFKLDVRNRKDAGR
jgi:hypothetical protein